MSFELSHYLTFKNGKSSPERSYGAKYKVFGSNGLIGEADKTNASASSIIIGRVGTYCGSVHYSQNPCWVTDNAIICETKGTEDQSYWYYFLKQLKLNRLQAGSGQPLLNQTILNTISVQVPETPEVRKNIGASIAIFDDKIELNQRMNKTLEEMAQAIFKCWFVDFEPTRAKMAQAAGSGETDEQICTRLKITPKTLNLFPNTLTDSELGPIPEGWEVGLANDLFSINIGKTPPRKESQWFTSHGNGIKWVSIKDMGDAGVFIFNTSEELMYESVTKHRVKTVSKGDVLLSFKLTIGRVCIATQNMCTNEAIAHFNISSSSSLGTFYTYCYLSQFNYESLGSTSSIAKAVNSKIIKGIPFVEPSPDIVHSFNSIVATFFNDISNRSQQNQTLAQTRDALLPKLLSGEISVGEAEHIVGDV